MKFCALLFILATFFTANSQPTLGKRKKPADNSVQTANRTSNVSQLNKTFPEMKMRLRLPLTSTEREYLVKKVGNFYVLNGDIIVGDDIPKTMSISINNMDFRWPNASLPLVIDPSVYMNGKGGFVHEAIRELNERTKLCLVPRTTERDYIRISFSTDIIGAGSSEVGKQGGEQTLLLGGGATKGTVLHEILHAAGFYHEQGRDDRDDFIHIFMDNVRDDAKSNFQKEGGISYGGYDFCSIMHYPGNAFAIDESKPTLICINNIETCRNCIGQREALTGHDMLGIDQFYASVTRKPCNTIFPNPNIPAQFTTVNISESDIAQQKFRHRADYAAANGFAAGFPNMHEATQGLNVVGGTILIRHGMIAWRDVPLAQLGNPPLNDFAARMRATQDYAVRNGFIGGFPNFHHANYGAGVVCGTFLLSNAAAEFRDVPLSELGNPPLNDIRARFTSANDYAFRNGYLGGFPTFYHANYGSGIVCGIILIKKEAGEWRDVILSTGPR